MSWTYAEAEKLLAQHAGILLRCELKPHVVGSVALKGASDNDLDIALSPLRTMTLEDGIERLERLLREMQINDPMILNEAANESEGWFANVLHNGRVIEFYFPADDFPLAN